MKLTEGRTGAWLDALRRSLGQEREEPQVVAPESNPPRPGNPVWAVMDRDRALLYRADGGDLVGAGSGGGADTADAAAGRAGAAHGPVEGGPAGDRARALSPGPPGAPGPPGRP
ncbi:MAG: hypothetical protein ACRD0J_10885 [Acidimicrobiales bacterium]